MWVLGMYGLSCPLTVNLLLKTKTNSAVTSVKGGRKLNEKANSGKATIPQTNPSVKRPSASLVTMPSVRKNVSYTPEKGAQMIPFATRFHSVRSKEHFANYHDDNHDGVRVTGRMFLTATENPNGLGLNNARLNYLTYLHPGCIMSRVRRLSQAFTKYRFERICITFQSKAVVTDPGEIFIGYSPDPELDPTTLIDEKLRIWFDSDPNTYIGTIAPTMKRACLDLHMKKGDLGEGWYDVSLNGTDVQLIHQGKILVAQWGGPTSVSVYGDLALEYTVVLADARLTITDIAAMSTNAKKSIPFPTIASNALMQFTSGGWSGILPGLYSIMNKELDNPLGIEDKTMYAGSEYLVSVSGVPTNYLQKFYNTFADFVNDSVTLVTTGFSAVAKNFNILQLIGNAAALFLLEEGGHLTPFALHAQPSYRKAQLEWLAENPDHGLLRGHIVHCSQGAKFKGFVSHDQLSTYVYKEKVPALLEGPEPLQLRGEFEIRESIRSTVQNPRRNFDLNDVRARAQAQAMIPTSPESENPGQYDDRILKIIRRNTDTGSSGTSPARYGYGSSNDSPRID